MVFAPPLLSPAVQTVSIIYSDQPVDRDGDIGGKVTPEVQVRLPGEPIRGALGCPVPLQVGGATTGCAEPQNREENTHSHWKGWHACS